MRYCTFTKIIILFSLIVSAQIFAHKYDDENSYPCRDEYPYFTDFSHKEGRGIGFKKGYTTAELFFRKKYENINFFPFFNIRGHIFNDGRYATNLGIGGRYINTKNRAIIGLNTFYDFRSKDKKNYHQFGFGWEILKNRWSLHNNFYLPVASKKKLHNYSFNSFEGYSLFYNENFLATMWGVDLLLGLNTKNYDHLVLSTDLGPYFYKGHLEKKAYGIKANAKITVFESLYLQVGGFYDKVFNAHIRAEAGFKIAFGNKRVSKNNKKCKRLDLCCLKQSLKKKISSKVLRHEIIVLSDQSKKEIAKSPISNQPYAVYHVNNSRGAVGGKGTYEDPFYDLASAQSASNINDIIYVNRGDGTTAGMDLGIILKNNQQFLGSGTDQIIDSANAIFSIPALTNGNPRITNTIIAPTPGVTLADNNVVSGFSIQTTSGDGIFASGITKASKILNNSIIDTGIGTGTQSSIAIQISPGVNIAGVLEIKNNVINSVNAGNAGISITDTAAGAVADYGINIDISNNSIIGNTTDGINITRTDNNAIEFKVNGIINNNIISGQALDGLFINSGTFGVVQNSIILDLTVSNNEFVGNNSQGAYVFRARGNLDILYNQAVRNAGEGIYVYIFEPDSLNSKIIGNATSNQGASQGMELYFNSTSGDFNLELIDNVFGFDDELFFTIVPALNLPRVKMIGNRGRIDINGDIISVP
ncbi:MAG: inverse autotransporter beta domain-containing protein [Parachlamydiales bacterium]|nr:inverse autotransporter beta domain-containing protein [Parachlamydiales bacterium]